MWHINCPWATCTNMQPALHSIRHALFCAMTGVCMAAGGAEPPLEEEDKHRDARSPRRATELNTNPGAGPGREISNPPAVTPENASDALPQGRMPDMGSGCAPATTHIHEPVDEGGNAANPSTHELCALRRRATQHPPPCIRDPEPPGSDERGQSHALQDFSLVEGALALRRYQLRPGEIEPGVCLHFGARTQR